MRVKALLGAVGFVAMLMAGGSVVVSVPAQAQHHGEGCYERIRHAERRLDRAIERWGRHSDAAREARHDLRRTREWCDRDRHHGRRHRDHDRW